MKHGLFLPPFDELADPRSLAHLAALAEEHGWDGVFLWDHVLRPDPPRPVADPWIALSAIAAATKRVALGPMITPIVRRRPQKLAREAVSLDHLSGGRLVLGMGLGVDTGRELSAFGEVLEPVERAAMLDEGLELMTSLWSGERVDHMGDHYRADGVTFLPRPVQRPRPPIWLAARTTNRAPLRRAARFDGVFAIEVALDELVRMLAFIEVERGSLDGFDVATVATPDRDPASHAAAGVTWWMTDVHPGASVADVATLVERGPPLF